jgi:hypothetical protein
MHWTRSEMDKSYYSPIENTPPMGRRHLARPYEHHNRKYRKKTGRTPMSLVQKRQLVKVHQGSHEVTNMRHAMTPAGGKWTSPVTSGRNIPRWTSLTAEYQGIKIPIAEAMALRMNLWLTSLNCSSLSEANSQKQINKAKLSSICWQLQRCGSDVMFLTDTRLTQKALEFIRHA